MTAVIVGVGQPAAGDDGIGPAVARYLATTIGRAGAVRESSDASLVLALLAAGSRVIVVDAVAGGGPPGTVVQLDPEALASGPRPLSSHGIGVAEAIELARTLHGTHVIARLAIVGIAIDPPRSPGFAMSPAVVAAIEPAARLALELARTVEDV